MRQWLDRNWSVLLISSSVPGLDHSIDGAEDLGTVVVRIPTEAGVARPTLAVQYNTGVKLEISNFHLNRKIRMIGTGTFAESPVILKRLSCFSSMETN